ncbi:unnamed protein product [Symbiodinium sp. KB8]|nr:unnamed protein product [Symbiodinium sp. KB8]
MAAKEDAPRFSQWRRVTALAGVALGTCLLAPLAVSCDARSSLTGELCEPAQNSGNLRGRRLSAHHIVHHVYGAGQHVMQHAYGAGSSVAHHVYGAGSSMMNHVYGAGSHVVHHVYHGGCMGLKIRRKSTSSPDTTATTSSVEVESTISDQIRSATATTTRYTHTIVHHHYGGHPGETYYVHPGSHHFMDHFADGAHVDCTDTGNWYYEWDAHKKHLCCSAVHVGCPGTWRGPEDHWIDSDTVGPADVSDFVGDEDFVNGKGPADVSDFADDGMVDSGTVEGGVVDDGMVDSGTVEDGVVDDGMVDSGTVEGGVVDDGTVESGSMDAVEGEVAEPEHTFLAEPIEKKQ